MINLDSLDLSLCDPAGSMKVLSSFPKQFEDALKSALSCELPNLEFKNIVVAGMGGSAVGGDILRALLKHNSKVFVEVIRGYELPSWVDKDTLLLGVSYSGNTEETLSACESGLNRGAKAIFISSGGKLEEMAKSKGVFHFKVPAGLQPRGALAYLSVPLLVFMSKLNLVNFDKDFEETLSVLQGLKEELSPEVPVSQNGAKELALWLKGSVPLIYGDENIGKVAAYRWKTQINENSKQPAYSCELPELNHNEIVGWMSKEFKGVFKVVALRHSKENRRTSLRFNLTRNLIIDSIGGWREVEGKGKSEMAILYSLIYFGDFVSLYLAYLNGVDPTPVSIINRLKDEMSKHL